MRGIRNQLEKEKDGSIYDTKKNEKQPSFNDRQTGGVNLLKERIVYGLSTMEEWQLCIIKGEGAEPRKSQFWGVKSA